MPVSPATLLASRILRLGRGPFSPVDGLPVIMLGRAIEPTNLAKEVTEARLFIVDASGKRLLSNRDKGLDRFLVGGKDIAVAACRLMMKRYLLVSRTLTRSMNSLPGQAGL